MREFFTESITLFGFTMPFSFLDFLLRFVLPALGFLVLGLLVRLVSARISRHVNVDEEKKANVLHWVRRIVRLIVAAGIVLAAISLLGAQAYTAMGRFFKVLNKPFFSSGNTSVSVITLILLVPVFMVASWIGKLVKGSVENRAFRRFGFDAERAFSVGRLIRYGVMTLVVIFGLSIIGIDISALGVLLGVAGIGLGFGLQSLVADFFAGIRLISMGMVKDGDRIRVEQFDGIIQQMRLLNTEITTFENESLIVPNSYLAGGVIHNYSYKDRRVVIVNSVDVAYESDLEIVIELMKNIGMQNPWRDKNSEVLVRVVEFASSGISMQLRTRIGEVADRAEASSWTNLAIWRTFRDSNVEIPFPQRVIRYREDSSPVDRGDNSSSIAVDTELNPQDPGAPAAVVDSGKSADQTGSTGDTQDSA